MLGLPPPFCPRSVLMRPDVGAVHIVDSPLALPGSISLLLHHRKEPLPLSLLPPSVEPTVYGTPRAVALRQTTQFNPAN